MKLRASDLTAWVSDFEDISVIIEEGNIVVEDTQVPWRPEEIQVYGSFDEFTDCVYQDVCEYLVAFSDY